MKILKIRIQWYIKINLNRKSKNSCREMLRILLYDSVKHQLQQWAHIWEDLWLNITDQY